MVDGAIARQTYDARFHLLQRIGIGVAKFDAQRGFGRHDIEAVGLYADVAAIDHAFGIIRANQFMGVDNESRRPLQSVAALIGGGGAGVCGFAIKDDVVGGAPDDAVDDAEINIPFVQGLSLLDMHLEEAEDGVGVAAGVTALLPS